MQRSGVWVLAGIVLLASEASAQVDDRFEITPMGGWQVGGSFGTATIEDLGEGKLNSPAAAAFGLTLDYTVRKDGQIELLYWRQNTELRFQPTQGARGPLFDMAVEYFHLGGLLQTKTEWAFPFAIASLGATRFNLLGNPGVPDEWRFSFALGGGAKVFPSRRFGLRGQARLWLTLLESDSRFFCVLPGGCVVNLSGSVLVQGEVSAGVILAF